MELKSLIFIFMGGGLGSLIRYALSKYLNSEWSIGTFIANLVGCFFIGMCIALYQKGVLPQGLFLFFAVGFCGGLTTFSTFAFELLETIKNQNWQFFFFYLFSSIILGIALVYVGFKISE